MNRVQINGGLILGAIGAVICVAVPPTAGADPSSQVSAQGEVRGGNYVQAPETVNPSSLSGCTYWEKSHRGTNGQAQEDFHAGFGSLVRACGG